MPFLNLPPRYIFLLPLFLLLAACNPNNEDDLVLADEQGYFQFVWDLDDNIKVELTSGQTDFQLVRDEEEFVSIGRLNRQRYDFSGRIPEGRYDFTVRRTADPGEGVLVEADVAAGPGSGGVNFSEPIERDEQTSTFSLIVEGIRMRYED